MKSSLFSYAIEEKKLYILMFCAFLRHIRKSNNSCVQVSWASPCPETKLTVQPCWSKNIFACFCRVQPDVALAMLILIVSRQMANDLSDNYSKLAKLLRSLEGIQVLIISAAGFTAGRSVFLKRLYEKRSHTSSNTPSLWNRNNCTTLDAKKIASHSLTKKLWSHLNPSVPGTLQNFHY